MSIYQPWQSWSPMRPSPIHLPIRDYPPHQSNPPKNQIPHNYHQKPPITGWCSWYAFGSKIDEKTMLEQAQKASAKKLEYFLIDDGWCRWGDWITPNPQKFPHGIKTVNQQIKKHGLKPGLWFAPFLIDPQSTIYKTHPEWVVKNKDGSPINAWLVTPYDHFFGFTKYLLDFDIPDVKTHILNFIDQAITDWGVKLVKIDFLYAPYFNPTYADPSKPHQILTDLFTHIRSKHPHAYTIACGCPYEPAKYLVDAIRISKDIALPTFSKFPIIHQIFHILRYRSMKNNFLYFQKNTQYFHLDPDVIISPKNEAWYNQHSKIKLIGYKL